MVNRQRKPNNRPNRDFVEAVARGIDVLRAFGPTTIELTVSEAASVTGLARPTVRRLLITLEELGYVRSVDGTYSLTAKVLEIGTAVIAAQGLWDISRPHMEALVAATGNSSSMSQLDGSDIVYTARVAVPKIIALSVHIGTRFPAIAASMGHVLLAGLDPDDLDEALSMASASGVIPRVVPDRAELGSILNQVRDQGWAVADEILSLGIRSVAAPVRDGSGAVVAALNVTTHAAETSIERLTGDYLPLLLTAADAISVDWRHRDRLPLAEVQP